MGLTVACLIIPDVGGVTMESSCWTPERLSELGELWAIARCLEQFLQTPPPTSQPASLMVGTRSN
ncbi:MAG: hypothetical protein RLZZ568_633 [Cyanobacteriota bacterium]